jgi:hypothetical protein
MRTSEAPFETGAGHFDAADFLGRSQTSTVVIFLFESMNAETFRDAEHRNVGGQAGEFPGNSMPIGTVQVQRRHPLFRKVRFHGRCYLCP